jgi:hypothetical protein
MAQPLTADAARAEAQRHVDLFYRPSLDVVVADVAELHGQAGWVAWLQTAAYLRTHDPLDFLITPPMLLTPGPTITMLPTAVPATDSLRALGLSLADLG